MDGTSSITNSDYTASTNAGLYGPPSQVGMIVPTVSEEEEQGIRINGEHLATLPRSVRWRIQLGLLQDPTSIFTSAVNIGKKEMHVCTLEAVLDHNHQLITKQADRFKDLVEKHLEEPTGDSHDSHEHNLSPNRNALDNFNPSPKSADIDPLTAMVMEQEAQETRKAELYLKYRKERARRKRGLTTEARVIESESDEIDQASLIIIEKDLKRLPHPSGAKPSFEGTSSPPSTTPELEARMTSLREILYIYAQEHPEMGYRQGMHEIASYLLYVLELEHEEYSDHRLFNPILPICFILLERTLDQLKTAYDASGGKSLQQMSIAILGKILQNNPALYHHLTNNPNIPPPPIYCTRWVRLMFSREVVGHENVFKLWDFFFSYANIMQALEIASASRILLISDALMLPENNTLDLLMNVPPMLNTTPLTDAVEKLMKQRESDRAIQLPSLGSTKIPTVSLRPNLPQISDQSIPPNANPFGQQSQLQSQQQYRQSPSPVSDSVFSFHHMRQSLNEKSESLRKKIITTTVEWKEAASRRDSSVPFDPLLGVASAMHSNKISADLVTKGNGHEPHRGYGDFTQPNATLFGTVPQTGTVSSPTSAIVPSTPKQHQHEMWSKLLQQKIWTVQQFLLDLESKENQGSVPRGVWEALAEMDKMQRELLNYSRSNMCDGHP